MDDSQTTSKKQPVKVRLARKWVVKALGEESDPDFHQAIASQQQDRESNSLEEAYLAGFDRGKAMVLDGVKRFCDELIPKRDGKAISEHLAVVGELP